MSYQFVKVFEVKLIVHIYCIFLSKLFLVINDIYILFKVVLSLTLLNYLRLSLSPKMCFFKKKKIIIFTQKFGCLSLVRGVGDDLSGLGLGPPCLSLSLLKDFHYHALIESEDFVVCMPHVDDHYLVHCLRDPISRFSNVVLSLQEGIQILIYYLIDFTLFYL